MHNSSWIKLKGVCPRAKTCTGAHGETELKAWNEHLERMGHEMQTQEKKKNEDFPEERAEASTHKVNSWKLIMHCIFSVRINVLISCFYSCIS